LGIKGSIFIFVLFSFFSLFGICLLASLIYSNELVLTPKITEPSKEYLAAEIGSFRNLHERNRYTLDLANKKFQSKRISFYSQENIVELNYLLALIDKGIRSSIVLLRENALR
jgi:hypothetical protein